MIGYTFKEISCMKCKGSGLQDWGKGFSMVQCSLCRGRGVVVLPVASVPANGGTETPANRGIQKPESVLEP